MTFPTQQEVHAKDRNPQADLSARSRATLAVLLLAQLTHSLGLWFGRLGTEVVIQR